MVGYFSTSKKSADLMCASRCSWPVLIELRSISAVTEEPGRVVGGHELAAEGGEPAPDLADHHVPDREADLGVTGSMFQVAAS